MSEKAPKSRKEAKPAKKEIEPGKYDEGVRDAADKFETMYAQTAADMRAAGVEVGKLGEWEKNAIPARRRFNKLSKQYWNEPSHTIRARIAGEMEEIFDTFSTKTIPLLQEAGTRYLEANPMPALREEQGPGEGPQEELVAENPDQTQLAETEAAVEPESEPAKAEEDSVPEDPMPSFDPAEARTRANEAYGSIATDSNLDSQDSVQARLARSRVLSTAAGLSSEQDPDMRAKKEASAREDLAKLEQFQSGEPVAWKVTTATEAESEETRKARVEKLRQIIAERYPGVPAEGTGQPRSADVLPEASPDIVAATIPAAAAPIEQNEPVPPAEEPIPVPETGSEAPQKGPTQFGAHPRYEAMRNLADRSKERLETAEATRLRAEEEYVSRHGRLGRGVRKLFGMQDAGYKKAEQDLNEAAFKRAQMLETYLEMRLGDRDYLGLATRLGKTGANEKLDWIAGREDRVAERYRRRFIEPEVWGRMDAHERSIRETRENAIRAKESTRTERAGQWIMRQNQKLDARLGKTGARITRTLASATVGSGVALAFGPVSWAIAGSVFATKAARGLAGLAVGTAAGLGAGSVYERSALRRGAQAIEKERASAVTSVDDIMRKRATMRAYSPEAIARKKQMIEMAVAVAAGAGANLGAGYLSHLVGTPPATPGPFPPRPGYLAPNGFNDAHPPSSGSALPEQAPAPHAAPPAPSLDAPHPEIPTVDVQAGKGFGYEWMAKRVEEQLRGLSPNPDAYPLGSDARQLLEASQDPNSPNFIDKVVHRLAIQHGFYNPDGTSDLVLPEDHMTVGADGQLRIGTPDSASSAELHAPEAVPAPTQVAPQPNGYPNHPSVPGHPTPQAESIEINAAHAGAFAPAALAAAYMATGEKSREQARRGPAASSETALPTESVPALTTDAEGRNLISNGSETERELYALKLAKERPGTPFMYLKKVRSGFLGLLSKDAWFMAYAEKGGEPGVFETVNNRDWRAVNLSKPGAASSPGNGPVA